MNRPTATAAAPLFCDVRVGHFFLLPYGDPKLPGGGGAAGSVHEPFDVARPRWASQ